MIRHQMSLNDLHTLSLGKLVEDLAQVPAQLPVDQLVAAGRRVRLR